MRYEWWCVFFVLFMYSSISSIPSVRADSPSQKDTSSLVTKPRHTDHAMQCKQSRQCSECHKRHHNIHMLLIGSNSSFFLRTRRYPAYPVSVPILHRRKIQALWSQNHDTRIMQCNASRVDNAANAINDTITYTCY